VVWDHLRALRQERVRSGSCEMCRKQSIQAGAVKPPLRVALRANGTSSGARRRAVCGCPSSIPPARRCRPRPRARSGAESNVGRLGATAREACRRARGTTASRGDVKRTSAAALRAIEPAWPQQVGTPAVLARPSALPSVTDSTMISTRDRRQSQRVRSPNRLGQCGEAERAARMADRRRDQCDRQAAGRC
jgi:hypothetical protein